MLEQKPKYLIFIIHLPATQPDNSKKWLKIHCKNQKNTKNAKLAIQVLLPPTPREMMILHVSK
jgi:hypothetical protein